MRNIRRASPSGNTRDQSRFESAAIIDNAFFESHPGKTQYRRKVVRDELPISLRELGVQEVQVFRITDEILLRVFIDEKWRVVGKLLSIEDKLLSTEAGRQAAQLCKKLIDDLMALKLLRGQR